MAGIKAIETNYKGYRFRSRLEARWAVFFDAIGVLWEYEKEGFDLNGLRYLPDFWLPKLRCWVEIKPECRAWYRWDEATLTYGPPADLRTPATDPLVYVELTKARRLVKASGFPLFMLFSGLCPLGFDDNENIVGSNKGWYPNGEHDDGCVTWAQCPSCCAVGIAQHGQHDLCRCRCVRPAVRLRRDRFWDGTSRDTPLCAQCGLGLDRSVEDRRAEHETWKDSHSAALLVAYRAARSARFEHGETPR